MNSFNKNPDFDFEVYGVRGESERLADIETDLDYVERSLDALEPKIKSTTQEAERLLRDIKNTNVRYDLED